MNEKRMLFVKRPSDDFSGITHVADKRIEIEQYPRDLFKMEVLYNKNRINNNL
jgi:hypothetical protein